MDALDAGGGTWVLFGDGVNVAVDTGNYIRGTGSIKYDISAAGGTTAGIQNTGLTSFDMSSFLASNGSAFVYTDISDADDITNFILRIGTDASNYYQVAVTVTHEGNAFETGWNLLRFDLGSPTEVGTVTDTDIQFAALYMTKDAAKVSQGDFRFDQLTLKLGDVYELEYFSKYGWQDAITNAWKENASADGDLLNADTDEYEIFVQKGIELAAAEADEEQARQTAQSMYSKLTNMYTKDTPSDAMFITQEYQDFI
jgi:hypothetical protein